MGNRKETNHIGNIEIADARHAIAQLMRLDKPTTLGLHVYRLMLDTGSKSIHYATIVESHHPDYLTNAELIELYPLAVSAQLEPNEVQAVVSLVLN